jgi:predicted transcriptional regulator
MMELRQIRSVLLISTLLILILGLPCVEAAKYVVEPVAHPDQITATPIDPVPVPVWSLSPREMAIFLALVFSPLLLFPVELLFFMKIFSVLGYRKAERNSILYNQNRQKIFQAIKSNPGIFFNDLCRITGINRGTLKYHVIILKLNRNISTLSTRGSDRYFENNGYYSDIERILLPHLREETPRKILEIVFEQPYISQKEIIQSVKISGPSVSWHMAALCREGIITAQKTGRQVQYRISMAADPVLRKYWNKPVL